MKSLSDLEAMQLPQLKAIARDLQLSFANNVKKADLVTLVFHAQQPNPDELEQDEQNKLEAVRVEKNLDENRESAAAQVDHMLEKIGNYFGGNLVELELEDNDDESGEDDGVVFQVVDPAGDEIVRGTYSQLVDKMDELEAIRKQQERENRGKPLDPIDPAELSVKEPERGVGAPPLPEGQLETVESELAPLRKLGLKVSLTADSVELSFRGRSVTTTLHQPVRRIVVVAEQLVTRN